MSRIIKPESSSTLRRRIMQGVAHSLNWAAQSTGQDGEIKDVAAFIILGLLEITESVDQSASAWEKRDYWLKADKFRLEWIWADYSMRQLTHALEAEDWGELAAGFGALAGHVSEIKIPQKMKSSRPWVGAYKVWSRKTQ